MNTRNQRSNWLIIIACLSVGLCVCTQQTVTAQNINVSSPFTSVSDSFHEHLGVNFGFRIPGGRGFGSRVVGLNSLGQLTPNLVFQQGPGLASAYGGYDPNGAGRLGFGNGNFSLGLNFSSGSTRTVSNVTPNLTVQNGYGGSIFSGSYVPFVTSVTPIVGGGLQPPLAYHSYRPDNAVTRAIDSGQLNLGSNSSLPVQYDFSNVVFSDPTSSAMRGDLPVAEIKNQRANAIAKMKADFERLIDEAESSELIGDYAKSIGSYRSAMKMVADKPTKEIFRSKIRALNKAQDAKE